MSKLIVACVVSFFIAIVIAPAAIKILTKIKFGQEIREEGPKWHASKSGTPTMGGIIFIVSSVVAVALLFIQDFKIITLLYLSLAFGVIGFIDDYIKVVKKRNLGLTSMQKLLMQIVASVLFVWLLYVNGEMSTTIFIPFTQIKLDLGFWYLPFSVLVILSCVNAVNLTDGIDGLASGVTVIVLAFFVLIYSMMGQYSDASFAAVVAGGVFGFWLFNRYPARVFMGDTGSLFLGGCVAALAVAEGLPLVLIICGGVYLIETASVILQVLSFKLTGKRIFKMSPIHHHFEMCGWSENKIVTVFSAAAILLCGLAYWSMKLFL